VKEAIFNIIGPYFDGGNVLDFYAGSGALGLEALSRGADQVYAFDKSRQAVDTIRANAALLHEEERVHVYSGNNRTALRHLRQKEADLQFQWLFLDPPYRKQRIAQDLELLLEGSWIAPGGIVVCELSDEDNLPNQVSSLHAFRQADYGSTKIVCYQEK